ncbi:MAG: hypothetical protein R2794_02620 [Chitinophagales bacterium]
MGFFRRSGLPSADQTPLLLYGLQRSGTNFFAELMRRNFPGIYFTNSDDRNTICHKHFRLYDDKTCIPEPQFDNDLHFAHWVDFLQAIPAERKPKWIFVVSKEPLSWLTSYRKWAVKNQWPQSKYDYMREYILFYGKWKEFADASPMIHFIAYEKLLKDPGLVLEDIARKTGLPKREKIIIPEKVYASKRFSGKKKKAILDGSYLEKYTETELTKYRSLFPEGLLPFMGYSFPG